jgi:hypothetical protein
MTTEGPKDGTTITSARKELSYDASTGRFFETNNDPGDCIPDDEYCVIDKESGELIRLTIEEKERIFLDALQVRADWMLGLAVVAVILVLFRCSIYLYIYTSCPLPSPVVLLQWKTTPQRR